MKKAVLLIFGLTLGLITIVAPVSALGLKVAPLDYKTTLARGEQKQGVIDISNPSSQTVIVKTSVQAFRQIDDDGGLEFYDDERTAAGIDLDLDELELGPRQAVRMPFTINGSALPEGDVYAAVFFTTDLKQPTNGVGQLVRVGTLLSIVNASPGPRSAEITNVALPFLQLDSTVKGTYSVKNTGPNTSGFYADVRLAAWPSAKPKTVTSTLVFGGKERANDFSYNVGYGIHRIDVGYGSSKKSQWVITMTPWMLVLMFVLVIVAMTELVIIRRRRRLHQSIPQ